MAEAITPLPQHSQRSTEVYRPTAGVSEGKPEVLGLFGHGWNDHSVINIKKGPAREPMERISPRRLVNF